MSFRVPTPDVSVVDLTCRLEKPVRRESFEILDLNHFIFRLNMKIFVIQLKVLVIRMN